MIVLLLALGCQEPEPEAPPFEPELGEWRVQAGQTWGGDCALADDATYLHEEQSWRLEPDRYGFAVRIDLGYRYSCALSDRDFSCDLPDIEDDFSSIGYDVYATYVYSYVGTFSSPEQFSGLYRIETQCEGEDCGLLTAYGEDFQFPCTAETSLEGALVGG